MSVAILNVLLLVHISSGYWARFEFVMIMSLSNVTSSLLAREVGDWAVVKEVSDLFADLVSIVFLPIGHGTVRLSCCLFQQGLRCSRGSQRSQGFGDLGWAKITQVNVTWNRARSCKWPQGTIGEDNSNKVDYVRAELNRGFRGSGSRTCYQWEGTVKGLYSQRERA